jgi:integrase
MAKKTFQQLSSEIVTKAKNGTLTIGEAIDFAADPRVPLPEDYNTKNKKGEYPARNRMQSLKSSLAVLQKKSPDAFPLGVDTPLKDMRQPEIVFLFRRDGSPDMSNRAYNYQTFENTFFGALKGKRVERLSEIIDGNEEDMYPRLAGSGNPMGTQRTGLAGERPMQGTLPKAELDTIYSEALPEISANYGEGTARLIEYHRTTFQRPEQLLSLTLNDVVVKGDTVTVKGKITTGKDHKGRPELTFKSDSPTGQLLIDAVNDTSGAVKGKGQSLFGVDADTFNTAFNNHIGNRLEKFSDVLPLADVKVEEGGKVVRIDQKPVTTPSAIRSIVPHYMLKDMKVNRDIVQGLMGHKPNDELGKNYTGVIVNEELPNVLQNPEAFAQTGFATTKGGQVGLQTDLLDEDQRAKLSEEYLDTQTAELQARTATAKATSAEMGLRQQEATVQRAAGMPEEVLAATTVAEGEAQIAQVESEARSAAKTESAAKRGRSHRMALRALNAEKGIIDPKVLKALPIPLIGTAAAAAAIPSVGEDISGGLQELFGVPKALADPVDRAGAVADFGIGEVAQVAPSDIVAGTGAFLESAAQSRAGQPSRGRNVPRVSPPKIPDPAPPAPDMAAQGFVPVPEARANAMRGETTAMDQAPSFLYGGVVR